MIATLKERHGRKALSRLCLLFGVTRQAFYQHFWSFSERSLEETLTLREVVRIRDGHPRMGGRKLYHMLGVFMQEHQIKMGRDAFFDLLSANGLLVRKKRRTLRTTNSSHWMRKYPNLIRDMVPVRPQELWVSDITYWKVGTDHVYISLVTDTYSHRIVGHHVAETLHATGPVSALQMALDTLQGPLQGLTHHSDRGLQYCSSDYVGLLSGRGIRISMTESGDPLENAIAERVNGIIKDEYLDCYEVNGIVQARELLEKVVKLYNDERPHLSIGNMTPEQVHSGRPARERLWKSYRPNYHTTVNQWQD